MYFLGIFSVAETSFSGNNGGIESRLTPAAWRLLMTLAKICRNALLLILVANNAIADDMDKGVLRIGAIFPFSGSQQMYGQEALAGMELALERVALTDPELVSRVEIVKGDDQGKPSEAARLAEHLISKDRVSLLFGSITAPVNLEIAKVAQRLERPLIMPAATNPGITSVGEYIFRTCLTDPDHGKSLAAFARSTLGSLTAATLVNKDLPYSTEMGAQFVASFTKAGGTVVSKELYDSKVKSYKDVLKKIADAKPDVIMIPARTQEASKIAKEMAELGMKIPVVGGDGWESSGIVKFVAKNPGGAFYYAVHFSPDVTNPSVADFVERFKKKVNRFPSSLAAMTFDGTLTALEAYRTARSVQASALTKALVKIKDLPMVAGAISINEERSTEKSGIIMEITGTGNRFKGLVGSGAETPVSATTKKKDAG
jgi:branched-chain amino acid transport system substrate-binding protein